MITEVGHNVQCAMSSVAGRSKEWSDGQRQWLGMVYIHTYIVLVVQSLGTHHHWLHLFLSFQVFYTRKLDFQLNLIEKEVSHCFHVNYQHQFFFIRVLVLYTVIQSPIGLISQTLIVFVCKRFLSNSSKEYFEKVRNHCFHKHTHTHTYTPVV